MRRVPVDAAAAIGVGVLAGALIALGWESPLRVVLALVFLLFGPGLAVAELLDVSDVAERLAVATGVSLGLETVVALGLLYAGAYSAGLIFAVILAVSVVLLGVAALRRPRASKRRGERSRAAT
jgi:uncharacterized membrane protein